MRILTDWEASQAQQWLEEARKVALQSRCSRARCGTVIVKQHGSEEIIASGFNGPPLGREENSRCLRKHEIQPGFKSDKTCCIHAEQHAIMHAMKHVDILPYCRLYFVRLNDEGQIKPSGKPYCTICSKMALHSGIAEFTLVHKEGITVYNTKEYNDLSFQYNG